MIARTAAALALGAALALAPPVLAAKKPPASPPPAPLGPPADADWRTPDPQNVLVVDTSKGRIIVELTPEVAPDTVVQIRELARSGIYNGRAFFRVLDGFMDQTGDPADTGAGQSTRPNLPPEFTFRRGADTPFVSLGKSGGSEIGFIGALPVISQSMDLAVVTVDHRVEAFGSYCPGVLGMARTDDPNTGNSQFFFMRDASPHLEKTYTAFGRAISGLDVIRAIKTGPAPSGAVAEPMDHMLKVQVLADMPEADRPKIRVIDPASAWFHASVDKVRAQKVILNLCDIDVPAQVQ